MKGSLALNGANWVCDAPFMGLIGYENSIYWRIHPNYNMVKIIIISCPTGNIE